MITGRGFSSLHGHILGRKTHVTPSWGQIRLGGAINETGDEGMMLQRQPAASAASTVVLVGCVAAALFGLGSRAVETTSAPIEGRTTTGSALRVASANLMLPSDLPSRRVASGILTAPAEIPAVKVAAANPFPPTPPPERPPAKAAAADPFPPMASLDLPAQAAASPAPAPERTYQLASASSMPEPESPVQAVAANPVLPVPEEAVSEHVASVSPTSPAKTLPALGNMMRLASVNPTEPVPDVQPSARQIGRASCREGLYEEGRGAAEKGAG